MKKVKVGIIGCGKFSKGQHLPNCQAAKNIELWCCNVLDDEERRLAEQFEPKKITSDYREILKDPEIDMVILALPHDLHTSFIEETANAGKHILCEKPMTMSMDESYRVIKAVKKNGVKLCVDYNRRFSPAMVDMKQAYQVHRNGKRAKSRAFVAMPDREIWPEEEITMAIIRINDESLTYRHVDYKQGGGGIIGECCHFLDLICWLFEDRPVKITAVGSIRMNHIITVEFANGSVGCVFFSSCGSFEYPKELVEIQDHGKIFRSECFAENQYYGLGERTVKNFDLGHDYFPEIGNEGGLKGYLAKIDATGKEFVDTGVYRHCTPNKGHSHLLEAFADAIINDRPSPIDEMAGMRATYMSLRAMDSIRQGTPMPVNIDSWEMCVE